MTSPVMKIRCGRVTSGWKKCRRVLATVETSGSRLVISLSDGQRQMLADEVLSANRSNYRDQLSEYESRFLLEDLQPPPAPDIEAMVEQLHNRPTSLIVGSAPTFLVRSCVPSHHVGVTPDRVFKIDESNVSRHWRSHRLDVKVQDLAAHTVDAAMLVDEIFNGPSRTVR